jgi:hypothetical protein
MDFTFAAELYYLIHFVDGDFVAHCLDMDLVGVGPTQDDAVCALNTAVQTFVYFAIKTVSLNALNNTKRAPQRYWDMFDEAKKQRGVETYTLEVSLEPSPVQATQCHLTYCLAVAA